MQERTINNKSDRVLKTPFFIYVKKFLNFFTKNLKFRIILLIIMIEKITSPVSSGADIGVV